MGTFSDAAQHGELLVLAVPGVAVESAIDLAGREHFAGKVVIDATNPLDFSGAAHGITASACSTVDGLRRCWAGPGWPVLGRGCDLPDSRPGYAILCTLTR